ncbi:hypothetical protein [Streptomyces sp. NPDC086787]|uniref:hypothetical protein n=1 Tax=Streptomyces sp. NPDC086787 TaxID=3365759 RepID=UPI003814E992
MAGLTAVPMPEARIPPLWGCGPGLLRGLATVVHLVLDVVEGLLALLALLVGALSESLLLTPALMRRLLDHRIRR